MLPFTSAMEASPGPPRTSSLPTKPDVESIKRRLLKKGVTPTPKIVHHLRKKDLQKRLRKSKNLAAARTQTGEPPLTQSQEQELAEESHFQTLAREYRDFTENGGDGNEVLKMVGKPWEGMEKLRLRELSSKESSGESLKTEALGEFGDFLAQRRDDLKWVLGDDIEMEQGWLENGTQMVQPSPEKKQRSEADAIRFLIHRLSDRDLSVKDWKFAKMMKQSGLMFTENQLLKIVGGLGDKGQWKQSLSVVEWVYSSKDHRHDKSRFVFTKLLAILGKARRPEEALHIFNKMRKDCQIYPDMAAYHSIAVTLGQAGLLRELSKIIDSMKQKPSENIKNKRSKSWNAILEPDVVVYNAVLNACVPSQQWKGVFWVFQQIRKSGLKPNGASYGLAMEVMLHSGKYDLVYQFFEKMQKSGENLKSATYKVLVKAYWKEGKIDEAVRAVRDMEQRGVYGTASVYYELACCLCYYGRWEQAMIEVEKLMEFPHAKELEITFTGLIMSAMDGGQIDDCISIFNHMKMYCYPNIGTINAMLKVYGQHDMFSKAKELFEEIRGGEAGLEDCPDESNLLPDVYTYSTMLQGCAKALQWEYFEYVYKVMSLRGYKLDKDKYMPLLVEAARAGKWHLLEHAFDSILEAGEIPHISVFTELLCLAITRQNYGRVVTLVNVMGCAPFQISEDQWTELFQKNMDRISLDDLKKCLGALSKVDTVYEATVANLFRSLECLCKYGVQKVFSGSSAVGNGFKYKSLPVPDDDIGGIGDEKRENIQSNFSSKTVANAPDGSEENSDIAFDITSLQTFPEKCDYQSGSSVDAVTVTPCNGDNGYSYHLNQENIDAVYDACTEKWPASIRTEELERGLDLDLLTDEVDDDQNISDLPSTNDILAAWRKGRTTDENGCLSGSQNQE